MNNITVSIIVSVYNHEPSLSRCLDNLAYQTLDNIEIILVADNNCSEAIYEIMELWQTRFSEKIQIINTSNNNIYENKNIGIKSATGMYISFMESIDYFDYKMFKKLYTLAENSNFPEMIYSPVFRVTANKAEKAFTLIKHESTEDYLTADSFYLSGKLFRSDLFERFGEFPRFAFECADAWLFPAISYITEIVYHPSPLYYQETSLHSIYDKALTSQNIEDVCKVADQIRELTNPAYQEYAVIYSLNKIYNLINLYPQHSNLLKKYIHEHIHLADSVDNLKELSEELYQRILFFKNDYYVIPPTIYINGFEKNVRETLSYLKENNFLNSFNFVVLDNNICDFNICPPIVQQAYKAGNSKFVGQYFALNACYTKGGIYLDSDIIIDHPLNSLINDPCFFGFESDNTFTDKIFGSCPGNACIEKILQTYWNTSMYDDIYAPLSSRIKTILIGMYNIKMRSDIILMYDRGVCIYPVEMFVYATKDYENIHVCHYKSLEAPQATQISLPLPIFSALWNRHAREEVKKENADTLRKDRDFLKNKVMRLENRTESLQKDCTWLQELAERQKTKIEKLDNNCTWLQNQKNGLEKSKDWLQNKVSRLETKKAGLEKDRDWLQNKVSLLETKKAGLEKDRDWLQNKVSLLETKKAGLEKDRDWLQNKVSLLETKKAGLEKDRDWLQNKNKILEKRVENLSASLNEFQSSRLARLGLKITNIFRKKK